MKKYIGIVVGGALAWGLAALVAACASPLSDPTVTVTGEITVREAQQGYLDIEPPMILNLLLDESKGDPVERCLDMGGSYRLVGVEHLCENVDYFNG